MSLVPQRLPLSSPDLLQCRRARVVEPSHCDRTARWRGRCRPAPRPQLEREPASSSLAGEGPKHTRPARPPMPGWGRPPGHVAARVWSCLPADGRPTSSVPRPHLATSPTTSGGLVAVCGTAVTEPPQHVVLHQAPLNDGGDEVERCALLVEQDLRAIPSHHMEASSVLNDRDGRSQTTFDWADLKEFRRQRSGRLP